jgi:hypothetical protein
VHSLRDLLVERGFAILQDKIGKTGREIIVRSPEGRVVLLCAASGNPYRDISVLEEIFYGNGKRRVIGPIVSLRLPWPHESRGY